MDGKQYRSRLKEMTYADRMRSGGRFPAVLRFASVHPRDVALIIGHAERRIGDVSHIDTSRSHLNRILVGEDPSNPGKTTIARDVMNMYRGMRASNHASNLRGLLNSRPKDHKRAVLRGPQEPWANQKKHRGPLREGVLTLHRDAFRAADDCPNEHVLEFLDDDGEMARFDKRICEDFVDASMGFLTENFGDQMPYCRVDFDEQSVHLQFLLVDVVDEDPSTRYASGRSLFRLTQNPLIGGDGKTKGYELAQDAVGEWFARPEYQHLNVVRAEPRAAQRREAAKQIEQMRDEANFEALLGEREELPEGSKNAQAMWLLKQRMSEATSEKSGKIRKDDAQNLALDYLVELGVVSEKDRHEASTRRARAALLERHEELVGTAHDIVAAPDAVAEKVIARARAEQHEAKRRAYLAEQAEQRAQDAERQAARDAEKRRAAEKIERDRRTKEEADRAAALDAKEREVDRKTNLLVSALREFAELGEAVKTAARKLGLTDHPLVQTGLEAVNKMRGLASKLTGHEHEK